MTKLNSNKKTRDIAVPFIASPFCFGKVGSPFEMVSDADEITGTGTTVVIRCATPSYANIVEAYLHLIMTVGSALTVKVAIGRFDSDLITAFTSYTQAEIDASHLRITGTTSALASSGGTLLIDGLNLTKEIPKRGDTYFLEKGFVLILQFSRARTGADTLLMYDIISSALLGLV